MTKHEKRSDRALTRLEVAHALGVSMATVYRLARKHEDFPPARRLGQGAVRWLESEIITWLHNRPQADVMRKTG